MDYAKESLRLHGEWKGKIEVIATVPANDKESLSLWYLECRLQPKRICLWLIHRVLHSLVLKFRRMWTRAMNTQDATICVWL